MLIVRKNEVNNLIATVSMNKTLANPTYLFSFQHIASKERISFIPEVILSNIRYDKFRFIEGSTTNLSTTPPLVNFEYIGQYYYSIYEQISPTNTNIDLAYNKLESGRAWVIVGDDNTQECFYEPYISNDEDFSQIIYVSDQEIDCQQVIVPTPSETPPLQPTPTPTATIGTTPTPTPTPGLNCPIFLCQASPQWIWDYNPTTNQTNYLFSYSGCATLDMALTDTKLFYYDGCQDLYEYNYTYNNGAFTQSFVKKYNPLPGKAWGAGLTAKDNNTLISSSGYTLSNTVNDFTTIFEYDLTTSGYTALFQLPYHYIVTGDFLYSPISGQIVVSAYEFFNASTSTIFCYDLSGNVINQVYTPNEIWYSLYYDDTTGKIVGITELGVRAEVNWAAGRVDYIQPIQNQSLIWGAGQKTSCQTYVVPPQFPPTPTQTTTPTTTPTMTPTPSVAPIVPLQFLVHRGGSQNSACNGTPNQFVYAQQLGGNCTPCLPFTCWPCLTTTQQVFSDANLTTIVQDGYYKNNMGNGNATWHIVGGFPQPAGFMMCP